MIEINFAHIVRKSGPTRSVSAESMLSHEMFTVCFDSSFKGIVMTSKPEIVFVTVEPTDDTVKVRRGRVGPKSGKKVKVRLLGTLVQESTEKVMEERRADIQAPSTSG
jgi:hypothetical protein